MIYHIRPIQKLNVLLERKNLALRNVPSILAVIPHIPDVLIGGQVYMERDLGQPTWHLLRLP
jgi:hypothetical protein